MLRNYTSEQSFIIAITGILGILIGIITVILKNNKKNSAKLK